MSKRLLLPVAVAAVVLATLAGRPAGAADDQLVPLWQFRNLGAAYLANDDLPEAAQALARAAQISPDDPADLRNAGSAALRAGGLTGARPLPPPKTSRRICGEKGCSFHQ